MRISADRDLRPGVYRARAGRGQGRGGGSGARAVAVVTGRRPGSWVSELGWLLRGHSRREPELPRGAPDSTRPGHGPSAPLRAWGQCPEAACKARALPGPRRPRPLTWAWAWAQPPSPLAEGWLSVAWVFPEGQVVREDRWFPRGGQWAEGGGLSPGSALGGSAFPLLSVLPPHLSPPLLSPGSHPDLRFRGSQAHLAQAPRRA